MSKVPVDIVPKVIAIWALPSMVVLPTTAEAATPSTTLVSSMS
jgi:hypothetical protein